MAQFEVKKEIRLQFTDELRNSFRYEINRFVKNHTELDDNSPSAIDFEKTILMRVKAIANRAFKLGLAEDESEYEKLPEGE